MTEQLELDLFPREETPMQEAERIIRGAREQTHGNKERSFTAIAILWNAHLACRPDPAAPITAEDVAWMMADLKKARRFHGTPTRDHFVDWHGYGAIACELAMERMKK